MQIRRIQQSCPELMKSMLAPTDCIVDEKIPRSNVAGFKFHVSSAVCSKLKQQYVKSLGLSVKCNFVNAKTFQFKMKPAMRSYTIDCTVDWVSHSLHWYEQYFFRFGSTSKRYIIHIGDHVQLGFDKFASVKQIYTYQPPFNKNEIRYVFFNIKHLKIAPYRDKVLQLNIFHKTEADEIISLTHI